MLENIIKDYRAMRSFQICIVFVVALVIEYWLKYSHDGWIAFSVMAIYAGFDSGTSVHRTMHRFWGAIFGLLISYGLWILIRIHYEFILFAIPCAMFMAFFTLGKLYAIPTTCTVTLTAMGIYYYTLDNYSAPEFFFDYARSTIIAFGICVFFEYFIFKKNNLMQKFYFDLQHAVVQELTELMHVVTAQPCRHGQYLKLSVRLNGSIIELNNFLGFVKHAYHVQPLDFATLTEFNQLVEMIYGNIRQLFVSEKEHVSELSEKTYQLLLQLTEISREERQARSIIC